MLPKMVLRAVESKCSSFLWKGSNEKATGVNVNWNIVTLPESEGGMGIKELIAWTSLAPCDSFGFLSSSAGSLWMAWLHAFLVKNRSAYWLFPFLAFAPIL